MVGFRGKILVPQGRWYPQNGIASMPVWREGVGKVKGRWGPPSHGMGEANGRRVGANGQRKVEGPLAIREHSAFSNILSHSPPLRTCPKVRFIENPPRPRPAPRTIPYSSRSLAITLMGKAGDERLMCSGGHVSIGNVKINGAPS